MHNRRFDSHTLVPLRHDIHTSIFCLYILAATNANLIYLKIKFAISQLQCLKEMGVPIPQEASTYVRMYVDTLHT